MSDEIINKEEILGNSVGVLDNYILSNKIINIPEQNKIQIQDLNFKYLNTSEDLQANETKKMFENQNIHKIENNIINQENNSKIGSHYENYNLPRIIESHKNPNNNVFFSTNSFNNDPIPGYLSKANYSYNTAGSMERDYNNNNYHNHYNENKYSQNNNLNINNDNNHLNCSSNSYNLNSNLDKLLENLRNRGDELEERNLENINLKEENLLFCENINNLEAKCFALRDENERLCRKIDEYQNSNKEWQKTVTQINIALNNIEENNNYLKHENENLKKFTQELELKLTYHNQKDLAYEDNSYKLKKIQEEYEDSIKSYKSKQEEMRKNYEEKEKNLLDNFLKREKELLNNIEEVTYENKKIQRENQDIKNELEIVKEKYKKGEDFLSEKEKEFFDLVEKKDNKLIELEKSLRLVTDEYEFEIIRLNKILKEKENEISCNFNKKASEHFNFEKELNEANLIIQELQTKCEFYKGKNNEYDQFCKDYEQKIQILEYQIEDLNEIISNKDKLIYEYEGKFNVINTNNDFSNNYNHIKESIHDSASMNNNNYFSNNNNFYDNRAKAFDKKNFQDEINNYDILSSININNENENIFLKNQLIEKDEMIEQMRNKINNLENTLFYCNSNSKLMHKEKKTLSPRREDINIHDISDQRNNSFDNIISDKKYNYEYKKKYKDNSSINFLESQNINLREELKNKDRAIFSMENQIHELKAVNKTCYDLLAQLDM